MITSLIIDDEQNSIDILMDDLLHHCPLIQVVGTCKSANDGIIAIQKLRPQLLFLDVEMPVMNGFEMLEQIPDINFGIIFITAYDKFAAKAFRISAIDFLLKPVDITDLMESVHKAEEAVKKNLGKNKIENLLHNIHKPAPKQKIAFPCSDGYEFETADSILYCAAEGAYTRVVFLERKPLLISKSLGDIEEMLPTGIFVRIHHSTIVNLNAIKHYSRTDGCYVVLSSNERLTVSKARKEGLLQQLGLKQ